MLSARITLGTVVTSIVMACTIDAQQVAHPLPLSASA
jgi:hypothetical protein